MNKGFLLGIASCVVAVLALVLAILSLVSGEWTVFRKYDIKSGLFRYCFMDVCGEVNDIPSVLVGDDTKRDFEVVIYCSLIGTAILPVSILFLTLKMIVMKERRMLVIAAGTAAVVSGLCFLISMAVFEDKIYDDDLQRLSTGFHLIIVAWLLSWSAASMMFGSGFINNPSAVDTA